ncbi:tetratricopeptide repeat protein [Amycolatopsis cynarae]|uniref:Tetratricopeptide repeat protein n=1 Tax=Amycolatopsis cynarae TaxID=2995223 RepID=A0ABY7AX56_9PSEU|nr:tetratricopeptide repeat protein [Amycolatopsis sp. HUAS 11-8]WAL64304.1 tetratricopeptide repeat protein [Amycolatopsis sp. HUAS 11-8]
MNATLAETATGGNSTFGELVLRHRRAAGLTQAALAGAAGLSIRALSDLERGRSRAAQRRSARALADALALTGEDRAFFLEAARQGRQRAGTAVRASGAPLALPPVVSRLVGRSAELNQLRQAAAAAREAEGGVVVSLVGHPGVGKTALAAAAAHLLRPSFPDGVFALDLRGMDDEPVTPRAALDALLRALGVPSPQAPATVPQQEREFRSLLAGRRVLFLLDNAADETQVRPLLARVPGTLTLITCRRALAGLESGRWIWLDPLSPADAVALVASIAGEERIAAEPEAAAELAELCGNLPLAMRIAGNRLASRPQWSVSYLVSLLRNENTRLVALSAGDLRVRSAFEMSYRRLSGPAREVFGRLAFLPGPDFGVEVAAVATGLPVPQMRVHLDELADANLILASPEDGRYSYHDLLRLFARERFEEETSGAPGVSTVVDAAVDHLLGRATEAARWFHPEAAGAGGRFASREEAERWLDRETACWAAAHRLAAHAGRHREVLALADALYWYAEVRSRQLPWEEVFERGLEAARELAARAGEAKMLNLLGWVRYHCLADDAAALATHQRALAVAEEAGEVEERAKALRHLAVVLLRMGRTDEALAHVRRAVAGARRLGFWTGQGTVLNTLGEILRAAGKPREALSVHRSVLSYMELYRGGATADTYRFFRSRTLQMIGADLAELADWPRAARRYRAARELFREGRNTVEEAEAAVQEGVAWREAGDHAAAADCLRSALAEFTEPAARWSRARTLVELAKTLELTGQAGAAAEHRRTALHLCRRLGTPAARRLAAELESATDPPGLRPDSRR